MPAGCRHCQGRDLGPVSAAGPGDRLLSDLGDAHRLRSARCGRARRGGRDGWGGRASAVGARPARVVAAGKNPDRHRGRRSATGRHRPVPDACWRTRRRLARPFVPGQRRAGRRVITDGWVGYNPAACYATSGATRSRGRRGQTGELLPPHRSLAVQAVAAGHHQAGRTGAPAAYLNESPSVNRRHSRSRGMCLPRLNSPPAQPVRTTTSRHQKPRSKPPQQRAPATASLPPAAAGPGEPLKCSFSHSG